MKKKLLILMLIIIVIIIARIILNIYCYEKEIKSPIIDGYINKEIIVDVQLFQTSYKYEKYIYDSEYDTFFINNYYKKSDSGITEKYEKYITKLPKDIRDKINIKELFDEEYYFYNNDLSDNELKSYLYIYSSKEHVLHYIEVVE